MHRLVVGRVGLEEAEVREALPGGVEVLRAAEIEVVDHRQVAGPLVGDALDEVTADEAGPAGDDDGLSGQAQ